MPPETSQEPKAYTGPEQRRHPETRKRMTPGEQAVEIVNARYNWKRPTDAEFAVAQFTGGEPVKKAVKALFDRLDGKLDSEKVEGLKKSFDRGVAIWSEAGLFTAEREEAGYAKPDFTRDYEPLLTLEDLERAEAGTDLDKGYSTAVFAPMDVPLHNENAEKLSYFKLLKKALLSAFEGTAGGKQPNTLLVGPDKRVLTKNEVNLNEILWKWERYLKAGVVHDVKKLDTKQHGGVSEEQQLAQLAGNEKRTGGIMRLERDQLIMPSDVGEAKMSAIDWEAKLPEVLPEVADGQNIKQAVAHLIYCLETQGWIPDFYDYEHPEDSKINLALKSFVPDEGRKGAVPALFWIIGDRRFYVFGSFAGNRYSDVGVRAGVRKKGA